jgi:hypothetical protein
MTRDEADRLLQGFAGWASDEPSWRGLALIGSWARGAARPDSDLDLLALTDRLDDWAAGDAWLRALVADLGFAAEAPALEVYGVARSWRVGLGPGVELEVTLAAPSWAGAEPVDEGTRRVVGDGMVVLVDKDGVLRAIQAAVLAPP